MTAKPFYFRHFVLRQDKAAMKVGTDAMLLGASVPAGDGRHILDIGTGTGVLALMLAQRSRALIDAIEIDEQAAAQARENAQTSAWSSRIHILHTSLQEYIPTPDIRYDLIVSNPPYYPAHDSRKSAPGEAGRKAARQHGSLSLEELAAHLPRLLAEDGRFYCILPAAAFEKFRALAGEKNLPLREAISIRSRPGTEVIRFIGEFGIGEGGEAERREMNIYTEEGRYSEEYIALTQDFHAHRLGAGEDWK